MDISGRLKDISIDFNTRKHIISLLIEEEPTGINELADMDLNIKLTKATKRRSLDSNAYFHVLCDKLRLKLNLPFAKVKNDLITTYGQLWYLDDANTEQWIYKTNAPPEVVEAQEEVHMRYLKTGEDGAYWYRVYRGSHTYDSSEMAKLIEGTIAECKEQDIETATPRQLAEMAAVWENRRKNG